MATLSAVMAKTLAQANEHTRNVFSMKPLTARQVHDLVRKQPTVVLATVKPNGKAHISLTGMATVNGKLYLGQSRAYAAFRNLQANPSVAVVVATGGWGRHVQIEGEARTLGARDRRNKAVAAAERKRHGWSYPVHVELAPTKVFTWAG